MCRIKKQTFDNRIVNRLETSINNQTVFWKEIKLLIGKQKNQPAISKSQWFNHFSRLFSNTDQESQNFGEINVDQDVVYNDDLTNETMKSSITDEEIIKCVHELNVNKASAGKSIAEHFKYGLNVLLPYIRVIFNRLFDKGEFPADWSKSIIVPLHKNGDINSPDNYRGIALLDILVKYIFQYLPED